MNNNEIYVVGKAGLDKIDIVHLAPNVDTIIFLKIPPVQFHVWRLPPELLKFNQNL
jgi:hypothetical protein